jgi:hypothetical protein
MKIVKGVIDPITKEYFEESKESLVNKLFKLENRDDNINAIPIESNNIEKLKTIITIESKSLMKKSYVSEYTELSLKSNFL